MPADSPTRILTINSGSSSIKFSLYHIDASEGLRMQGMLDRIGVDDGTFRASDGSHRDLVDRRVDLPNHDAALQVLLKWLRESDVDSDIDAVGHRIVHGGARHTRPERVTPDLIALLRQLIPLAPDHLPHEIDALESVENHFPGVPQVACFDTAFHRTMPELAQVYPLPARPGLENVLRYGFHGLSCEYIISELRAEGGDSLAEGRIIIAHLGNGASMTAVSRGRSVDTTMGFTPTGGLVMSTRSGDLDPSVVLHLIEQQGLTPANARDLLNHQAGLLGLSGLTSDMKDLLDREAADDRAALAVAVFCYQARKFVAGLAAVLGGLDILVFTGGIGENSIPIRRRTCEDLQFLGIHLDRERNQARSPTISRPDSPVTVRVMHTNEELMIARHAARVVGAERTLR